MKIISRDAVTYAIAQSQEAQEKLFSNKAIMDRNVYSEVRGLTDPTIQEYVELSDRAEQLLTAAGQRIIGIQEYCEKVLRWLDDYTNRQ